MYKVPGRSRVFAGSTQDWVEQGKSACRESIDRNSPSFPLTRTAKMKGRSVSRRAGDLAELESRPRAGETRRIEQADRMTE